MRLNFKDFLISENTAYLSQRVGDIQNALQDLKDNAGGMGKRQVTTAASVIVNQIRTILHSNWSKKNIRSLASLQKVGVAVMRAIEDKDDLTDVLTSSIEEMQKMAGELGTPINQLASPEGQEPQETQPTMAKPEGRANSPEPPQPEQPQMPPQQPQMPQMPQQQGMPPQQPQMPQSGQQPILPQMPQ
jgi:hypothetical protein